MQMESSPDWYVVMTKPRLEKAARDHLQQQDYEVYLPLWQKSSRQGGSWQSLEVPMFPRYLFLRPTRVEQSLAPVRSTRAVSSLVRFGGTPAMASAALVADIAHTEARRRAAADASVPFSQGDLVAVVQGPLRGVSAEVFNCDQDRVMLLLQMLGQVQRIELDVDACVAL